MRNSFRGGKRVPQTAALQYSSRDSENNSDEEHLQVWFKQLTEDVHLQFLAAQDGHAKTQVRLNAMDKKLDQIVSKIDSWHPGLDVAENVRHTMDNMLNEWMSTRSSMLRRTTYSGFGGRPMKRQLSPVEKAKGGDKSPARRIPLGQGPYEMAPLLPKGDWPLYADENCDLFMDVERTDDHRLSELRKNKNRYVDMVTNFLDDPDSSGTTAMLYARVTPVLILVAVFVNLQDTARPPLLNRALAVYVETAFDAFFSVEILVRFAFCPNHRTFFRSPTNVFDILSMVLAIVRASERFFAAPVSWYLSHEVLPCAVPVFRLLKLVRRFPMFNLLIAAFDEAFEALPVLLYTMFLIASVFASLIYLSEPRDNIDSLPVAAWLTITTMTTVGYGDMVPASDLGCTVATTLMILSLLYMALPIGIIGYSFTGVWSNRKEILSMQRTRERLVKWGYGACHTTKIFERYDTRGCGEITLDQFRDMIREMGLGLKDSEVSDLFHFFDKDGGGTIDEQEFVRHLFPNEAATLFGES